MAREKTWHVAMLEAGDMHAVRRRRGTPHVTSHMQAHVCKEVPLADKSRMTLYMHALDAWAVLVQMEELFDGPLRFLTGIFRAWSRWNPLSAEDGALVTLFQQGGSTIQGPAQVIRAMRFLLEDSTRPPPPPATQPPSHFFGFGAAAPASASRHL